MSKFESSKNLLTATLFSLALPHCAGNQTEPKAAPAPANLLDTAIQNNDETMAKVALARTLDPKAAIFGFQPDGSLIECEELKIANLSLARTILSARLRTNLATTLNNPEVRQFIKQTEAGRTLTTTTVVDASGIGIDNYSKTAKLNNGKKIWCAKGKKIM